ncbi:MAG: FAD-dependent oxidoreductase [Steroidobacteraceae bacterium]
MARPLLGTLFFAGEAADADGEVAGTVAGALQSGERVAREVLRVSARSRR